MSSRSLLSFGWSWLVGEPTGPAASFVWMLFDPFVTNAECVYRTNGSVSLSLSRPRASGSSRFVSLSLSGFLVTVVWNRNRDINPNSFIHSQFQNRYRHNTVSSVLNGLVVVRLSFCKGPVAVLAETTFGGFGPSPRKPKPRQKLNTFNGAD